MTPMMVNMMALTMNWTSSRAMMRYLLQSKWCNLFLLVVV